MIGSREYVRAHRADLDHIVLAGTIDTGCGQVTGWVTGARPDVTGLVDRLIAPAANLGPFTQVTDAMSGTDHFDFMLFAARTLGHPVLLYDGSFEDWSRHADYPVEAAAAK